MAAQLQYTLASIPNLKHAKLLTLSGDIDESNQAILISLMEQLLGAPQVGDSWKNAPLNLGDSNKDDAVINLIINIKNLTYINSGVIGLFATFHAKFTGAGKDFVFAETNEHIMDIIDLVGLTSVITVFATNNEAALSFED